MLTSILVRDCSLFLLSTVLLFTRRSQRRKASPILGRVGIAIVAIVTFTAPGSTVLAQESKNRTVESEKTLVLTYSQAITNEKADVGNVEVRETDTTPKKYHLVYIAPKVDEDTSAVVTFDLEAEGENETKSIAIKVTARAQPPTLTSDGIYMDSFKALYVLFIIAILLESGLAIFFNWRPFVQFFDARGVKTIVSFAFAYFFVSYFHMDIVTRLVNLYSGTDWPISFPGMVTTALILAGGSSAVNNLFKAFGFRSVARVQEVTPQPESKEAWIAVNLDRVKAVGPVYVMIKMGDEDEKLAGTITGRTIRNRFFQYFFRDQGRFPTVAGHPVNLDKTCTITLKSVDKDGEPIPTDSWGPHQLANKAIVDLNVKI